MPPELRGIVVPLATPLDELRRLDQEALERLLCRVLEGGVAGVFVVGTTGEGPHLDVGLQAELIRRACRICAGRAAVLAGVCNASAAASQKIADTAAECGADALVLTPPFYFPLSQEELLAYLRRTVPALPLPTYLYNIPQLSRIKFEPETVERAAAEMPIAGLKDSSGDMRYFAAVRAIRTPGRFRLFCGPEERLLEATQAGGDGGVCGGANLFPRLYVDLYEAAAAGRLDEAARLQATVHRLSAALYSHVPEATSYLRGLKCALAALEVCQETFAEPLSPLPETAREKTRAFLGGFTYP